LADRGGGPGGGGAIDVVDTRTNTFLCSIPTTANETRFVGVIGRGRSGPNGVVLIPQLNQLYAGDGYSTVKVVCLEAKAIVATIPVCGTPKTVKCSSSRDGFR
jgi:DNA-binding beta-propeller fold protein YncE